MSKLVPTFSLSFNRVEVGLIVSFEHRVVENVLVLLNIDLAESIFVQLYRCELWCYLMGLTWRTNVE